MSQSNSTKVEELQRLLRRLEKIEPGGKAAVLPAGETDAGPPDRAVDRGGAPHGPELASLQTARRAVATRHLRAATAELIPPEPPAAPAAVVVAGPAPSLPDLPATGTALVAPTRRAGQSPSLLAIAMAVIVGAFISTSLTLAVLFGLNRDPIELVRRTAGLAPATGSEGARIEQPKIALDPTAPVMPPAPAHLPDDGRTAMAVAGRAAVEATAPAVVVAEVARPAADEPAAARHQPAPQTPATDAGETDAAPAALDSALALGPPLRLPAEPPTFTSDAAVAAEPGGAERVAASAPAAVSAAAVTSPSASGPVEPSDAATPLAEAPRAAGETDGAETAVADRSMAVVDPQLAELESLVAGTGPRALVASVWMLHREARNAIPVAFEPGTAAGYQILIGRLDPAIRVVGAAEILSGTWLVEAQNLSAVGIEIDGVAAPTALAAIELRSRRGDIVARLPITVVVVPSARE